MFHVSCLGTWWRHDLWITENLKFDYLKNDKSFRSEIKNNGEEKWRDVSSFIGKYLTTLYVILHLYNTVPVCFTYSYYKYSITLESGKDTHPSPYNQFFFLNAHQNSKTFSFQPSASPLCLLIFDQKWEMNLIKT